MPHNAGSYTGDEGFLIEPEVCPTANPQTCCQVAVEFKTQLVPPALASADVTTEVFFTQSPVVEDVCPEKVIICGTVAKRITYTAVDEQGNQCPKVICDERSFQCIIDLDDANEGDTFEVCGFAILCEGTPRLQNRGTRPGLTPTSPPVDVFWKVFEKDIVKVCIRKFVSKKNIFDYIVIGAGTTGGVIAKELTDDKSTSVLVLEAGTNMPNPSPSSATANALANDNKLSFNALSKFEQNIGRQLKLWSGRVIGGSSQHNFMTAVRGSRDLYDEWANLLGDKGDLWRYKNIRSLFKQNETYTGNTQDPNQRGTTGPIFIRQQNIPDQGLIQTLAQATSDVLGIPIVEDYNTGIRDCTFFKTQFTQQEIGNGKFVRSSTATGYLNENIVTQGNEVHPDEFGIGRRKLTIFAKTTVNKILFKEKKGVNIAVGVDYVKDGVSQRSFARKGIIVAAGNFSSVILQRSGIGEPTDLANAGISTLVESPNVGRNFQTHNVVGMGVRVETNRLLQILDADPDNPVALHAFKKEKGPGGRRLQLIGNPFLVFVPISDVLTNQWQFNPNLKSNIMSFGIVDLNPKSKGKITVAHSDPEAYPSISFNPFANDDDLNYMVDQYIETFKIIMKARELDSDGIYKVVFPPEEIFKETNEEKKRNRLADFAKASYFNFAHYGGQCKMGKNIQEGVVDGFLNVFGTKNLKVADLSISPILPDGNTSIPSQMIGLNAVRFIQEDPSPYVLDDEEFEDLEHTL